MFILTDVTCNGITFDSIIPNLVTQVVKVIQFGMPIVLIILGMVDLGKAVMSNDEKEMKAAQGKLIKRVIYAVAIFLIVAIVKLVFGLLTNANNDKTNKVGYVDCIDCFVNYNSKCKTK